MNILRLLRGGLMLLLILPFLAPASASAMQSSRADTVKVEGKDVSIEVVNGKVWINGEEVDDKDHFVYKIEGSGDRDEDVFVAGPRRRMRFMTRDAEGLGVVDEDEDFEALDGDDRIMVKKFKMRMPDHAMWKDREKGFMAGGPMDMDENVFVMRHGNRDDMEFSPEIMKMEHEAAEMARKARKAEGKDREKIQSELKKKLADIFAKKMEIREERLEALRSELEEGRKTFDERRKSSDKIIDRRLKVLMGDDDVLDW